MHLFSKAIGFIIILHCLIIGSSRSTSVLIDSSFDREREAFQTKINAVNLENIRGMGT